MGHNDDHNDTFSGQIGTSSHPLDSYHCIWTKADFYATVKAKKAISAGLFILFMAYTVLVMLRHKNRAESLALKFNRVINEIAYAHLFFFFGCIFAHVLVPKGWPVVLIYAYIASIFTEMVAGVREKQFLTKICFFI